MFTEEHKWLDIYLKIQDHKYTHNMADLTSSYSSENIAHKTNTNLGDIVLNKHKDKRNSLMRWNNTTDTTNLYYSLT